MQVWAPGLLTQEFTSKGSCGSKSLMRAGAPSSCRLMYAAQEKLNPALASAGVWAADGGTRRVKPKICCAKAEITFVALSVSSRSLRISSPWQPGLDGPQHIPWVHSLLYYGR